jgi:hypothetical protein
MVECQLRARGIDDARVLDAMGAVPRELFVPDELRHRAYDDAALPIGADQTISQPYMVALICSLLELRGGEHVLDVGTGSGYQAAVLAALGAEVHSVELVPELAARAREAIRAAGCPRRLHSRRSPSRRPPRSCRRRCTTSWRRAAASSSRSGRDGSSSSRSLSGLPKGPQSSEPCRAASSPSWAPKDFEKVEFAQHPAGQER